MPKIWKQSGLIALTIFLTACPRAPKTPARLTPLGTTVPEPLAGAPRQDLPPREAQVPEPIIAKPTNVSPSVMIFPLNQWVSWESWNQVNGLDKPKRVENGIGPTFHSRSSNGVFSVTMGSRVAYWNGLALALGFVPHLTNGHPFLHSLDLLKNFAPLISSSVSPTNEKRRIVIDPGHGGENSGAKNIAGSGFEKDYTLDWALRLKPLLVANGWNVLLTRTDDVDLSLGDRVRMAERAKADLFISLHFNSVDPPANRSEHNGIETYCLTPTGMPSNVTRNFKDDLGLRYANNAFDRQNLQYAFRLHQAVVHFSARKDGGIRHARFLSVLRDQNRPAVLIEGGYLTDPQEARLIANATYRQKLAEAVAKALE